MSNKGCTQGCIHRKDIKIGEMKDIYEFRCAAQKKYITKEEIKTRCNLFQGPFTIKEFTVDEFLDD